MSDGTWRAYGTAEGEPAPVGWNTPSFDDEAWALATAPNPGICTVDGNFYPEAPWQRLAQSMWAASDSYSAFFRRWVTLPEGATVTFARIITWADDDMAVWVNGLEIYVEPDFGIVAGNTIQPHELDLQPFLVPGANLIALHAQDTVGFCRNAIVSGSIEFD